MGREGGGLAKVDEVLEGEGERNRLGQLDVNVLFRLVNVGVAAEGDGSIADVAGAGELDSVLAGIEGD